MISLPRSGECSSVAEEQERRLVMTGSVCLDKFIVDTDRLSASIQKQHNESKSVKWYIIKVRNVTTEKGERELETFTH